MHNNVKDVVMAEYEAQRRHLSTDCIGMAELVEKTMQMLIYISENNLAKE